MDMTKFFNIGEFESNLTIDDQSIGTFIGISDQIKKCWKFAIYLGRKSFKFFLFSINFKIGHFSTLRK
jgi:hypothetical protein